MSNWFASIGQASSGLDAARYGLTVVSQNIENASTPGYSRQSAVQAALETDTTGLYSTRTGLPALNGVSVASTARADDPVLDARARGEHANSATADTAAATLTSVETTLGEPSTDGLSAQLSAFWASWATVANDPGSTSARGVLLQDAGSVVGTLHGLAGSLNDLSTGTSASLDNDVTQVNSVAQQLATLNGQIAVAAATGQTANSLLDSRDQLLDTLSTLAGATASLGPNGAATVTVGGQSLVSGTSATAMSVDASHQVSVGGTAVTVTAGSVAARVTDLTTTIPGYSARLDAVADSLASAVNGVQGAGYDSNGNPGSAMFTGSGAAGITVALTDPAGVAASGRGGGANLDGGNALKASQQGGQSGSPDKAYATLVGDIGAASAAATQRSTMQATITGNVDSLRASVSGVSYDEEVSSMLTYQHAFSASSRVLTTIDQMLDTLINHTGVVGQA